jgi:crotonobetainyl-CoA:carnitine CoA-transferase CaiB-like acyl-CoA transferase
MTMQPLKGIKVLDFSTLLPGPMCTLMLADAGAEVIKIERAAGDEMRAYAPKFGTDSVNFALLNRGKKSVVADLKSPVVRQQIEALILEADVLIEQFRPGVMQRLGLGYDAVSRLNPRLIYCSITGFGQTGPYSQLASHDLNYQAQTGMLNLTADDQGKPGLPPMLTADLAGGAYPAMMNILLGLRKRDQDGLGCHIDVSMSDNLFPLMYWGLGNGWSTGNWPAPNSSLVTGGTARYQIYQTADNKFLAAAPLEDKFWETFLDVIGAPELRDIENTALVKASIAKIIAGKTAAAWMEYFRGRDTCVSEIVGLEQAVQDPHFQERGLFNRSVSSAQGAKIPALPTSVSPVFLANEKNVRSPELGQHTTEILK